MKKNKKEKIKIEKPVKEKKLGKNKKDEVVLMPPVTFKDKKGKEVSVLKILEPSDYWSKRSRSREAWMVKHLGVEKLAEAAGIKRQIDTHFVNEFLPSIENGMINKVRATLFCRTKQTKGVCVHGSDAVFFSPGEAARMNTYGLGGKYLTIMAEKRAYDRGVLDHLGLKEKINIYSEEESPDMEEEKIKPMDEILMKLAPVIQLIINAKTKEDLLKVAAEIKGMDLEENDKQYLRGLYVRQLGIIDKAF